MVERSRSNIRGVPRCIAVEAALLEIGRTLREPSEIQIREGHYCLGTARYNQVSS